MRVLVTGGSGFIGSHVVDKLLDHGHEPVIYDLRYSPWHEDGAVETVIGSITDRAALEQAMDGCDAVAHLAAVADVNDVHAEPEDAEHVNARGTAAVLEAARRAGVGRVVYASTIWVYSDTEAVEVDEDTLLPPPSHLYTSTKLAGELYCKSYQELYGIDYTVLRFGIPYGPRAREAAVIPAFVNKAFAGDPLTLAGDGMQSRRFVYVEDLAEGVALGLSEVARNRVYNLTSDEDVTIKQIAETVQELVGNTEIVYTPARPGDFGSKIVASDRARDELGWTASTPFVEGVRRYIEWRREQAASRELGGGHPLALAGEPDSEVCPRKILIVSADIGEGHDLPAREVAREFSEEDPEAQVSIVNGLPAMGPGMTALLRENSAFMFRWVPWLFDAQYRAFMKFAPTRWLARYLLTLLGGRGLMRLIKSHKPDLIVSTYPGVTAILGELRRRGRLRIPCYSSITDLAGLQFWAHPGIDLHFITHPESVEEVERIAGPGSVRWARPPICPAFLKPRGRLEARRALGLPADATVIVVSGGGWGVGDMVGAVQTALEVPDSLVLCLCGRNESTRTRVCQQFADEPRVLPMGFTTRMGEILAAGDALVHSSAGLTVLESLIRGCPVISYGFGYGHVRESNRAFERFGLAQVARNRAELGPALHQALSQRPEADNSFAKRPTTASLILSSDRRSVSVPAWRLRAVRTATGVAATVLVTGAAATTSFAYAIVSHFAPIGPTTQVTTPKKEIGVMVDTSSRQLPTLARELSSSDIHVSFAVYRPSMSAVYNATLYGDETVPRLPDSGVVSWIHTRSELGKLIHGVWHNHFLYASSGPSIWQVLSAQGAGGRLIKGTVQLTDRTDRLGKLHPGEIVELSVKNVAEARALLHRLGVVLRRDGLHQAVPVTKLLKDSGVSI